MSQQPQYPHQPQGWQQPQYPPQGWHPQQQVQPYQPQQPYQYAPPGQPGRPAPKSPGLGLFLGLLPPSGIGCMYAGRPGIGAALMAGWVLSIALIFVFGIGFVTGFAVWVTSGVLGFVMTREHNAARGFTY